MISGFISGRLSGTEHRIRTPSPLRIYRSGLLTQPLRIFSQSLWQRRAERQRLARHRMLERQVGSVEEQARRGKLPLQLGVPFVNHGAAELRVAGNRVAGVGGVD